MDVYVLLEVIGDETGGPDEMADVVLGVFLTEKGASECMEDHMSYYYSQWGEKLIREGHLALTSYSGIPTFEIVKCPVSE